MKERCADVLLIIPSKFSSGIWTRPAAGDRPLTNAATKLLGRFRPMYTPRNVILPGFAVVPHGTASGSAKVFVQLASPSSSFGTVLVSGCSATRPLVIVEVHARIASYRPDPRATTP
jgi:hypothetical protein